MTQARLGTGRYIDAAEAPSNTVTSVHELTTADGAKVSGVLRTVPGAETVVALMHPRQDLTHHVLVPELLARGYAVWTQGTRSVNNDISLVHEQALLDAAAGQVFLRSRSFGHVVTLGHSGGGTLFAFYHEQAGLAPGDRLAATPAGRPIDLASAEMPVPDGAIFMAPHPGQGALLLRLIDPSVVDESDPMSIDPALDPFDGTNGFADAPESSSYSEEFVGRYRVAQRERVARLDALARSRVAEASDARRRFKTSSDPADRRDALAPRILTVYRTDADLRFTDLSLSPNARPYGSLFGRRPDLTNYGLVGFARLSTPDAWLSTWSGLSSNADFVRCAPSVTAPSLFVELTGDQACFPEDASRMAEALGSVDKTRVAIEGTHFGGPIRDGAPTGASLAAADIGAWLSQHFI
ncbi:alpha/beta hydrolase [Rhodococcus sp. 06-412-2C]|uniref:alpha/beta hydrolase n=1 Tax=unclassified Rhodococcus (in: high G+C Gram-positive bacteria) TaxID=192944 RepID=UPI000B9ABE34|nr:MULTISPECIES: alpha/beta hydrolase [unclassified Rhodococcus (in: high G+C Gram-positive bacteria)]OZC87083.1 alpha/beta hydrolase [Rhodococcus sp. 06-412-2C]OZC99967.1 alpha/beta hydrolase [Rhodococcus sp. 06-412-2B]